MSRLIARPALGMRTALLALALGVIAAFLIGTHTAAAGPLNEFVSGNFSDTALDTNNDGTQANLFSGATKGSGSATYEGIIEIAITGPSSQCGQGEVAGVVVAYSIVRRYANGDLLFSRLDQANPGSLCFNLATGLSTLTINANLLAGKPAFTR